MLPLLPGQCLPYPALLCGFDQIPETLRLLDQLIQNCDISHCTLYNELPDEAKGYIEFLEKQLVHVIQFVSTGAEREQYLLKGTWL